MTTTLGNRKVRNVRKEKAVVRSEDERYTPERRKQILRNIHSQNSDPFHIPPEKIPDGISYYWCRRFIFKNGEGEDAGRYPQMVSMGWDPVPYERHADLFMPATFRGAMSGCIEILGHILLERPEELTKEEWRVMHGFNKQLENTVPDLGEEAPYGPRSIKKTAEWMPAVRTSNPNFDF